MHLIIQIEISLFLLIKIWPIEDILDTIKDYKYQKYRPIMFEYVLINGVNDSIENAIELSNLLKKFIAK